MISRRPPNLGSSVTLLQITDHTVTDTKVCLITPRNTFLLLQSPAVILLCICSDLRLGHGDPLREAPDVQFLLLPEALYNSVLSDTTED